MSFHLFRRYLTVIASGLVLGFTLSRIGFSDFGVIHRMFTLADLRPFLAFMGGTVSVWLGYLLLARWAGERRMPHQPLHKGTLPGSLLYGVGWALTGACPGVPLVQLGEGYLSSLFTAAGIIIGMLLFKVLNARVLKWDVTTCG